MKTLNQFYFIILVLFIFSCQKTKFEKASTIADLIHYSACMMTPCGDTLPHKNEEFYLKGIIYKVNVFENENRFIIFESDDNKENNPSIEIIVKKNKKNIFEKINRFIDKNESAKIYVRGKIQGKDLLINGNCVKGLYLEIDHALDIRF